MSIPRRHSQPCHGWVKNSGNDRIVPLKPGLALKSRQHRLSMNRSDNHAPVEYPPPLPANPSRVPEQPWLFSHLHCIGYQPDRKVRSKGQVQRTGQCQGQAHRERSISHHPLSHGWPAQPSNWTGPGKYAGHHHHHPVGWQVWWWCCMKRYCAPGLSHSGHK